MAFTRVLVALAFFSVITQSEALQKYNGAMTEDTPDKVNCPGPLPTTEGCWVFQPSGGCFAPYDGIVFKSDAQTGWYRDIDHHLSHYQTYETCYQQAAGCSKGDAIFFYVPTRKGDPIPPATEAEDARNKCANPDAPTVSSGDGAPLECALQEDGGGYHLGWCQSDIPVATDVDSPEDCVALVLEKYPTATCMSYGQDVNGNVEARRCYARTSEFEAFGGSGSGIACELQALTKTGICTVVEDPHINVFDGSQISLLALEGKDAVTMSSGDKWLVKSGSVSIQARFMADGSLNEKNEFVRAVAVGGTFLQGNTIAVGSLEDQITWNGKPILEGQNVSSGFRFHDGAVFVEVERSDHSLNVADMKTENRGIAIKLPLGVSLIVNRLRHHLNVAITMPQQELGQDGMCGNFNGLASDDSLEMTSKRIDVSVPYEESLFAGLTFS